MTIQAPSPPRVGWRIAKIGELFDSWGGHTPSKANASYWGQGLPWVSSKELKTTRLRSSTYMVTQKAIDETGLRVCPTGSVLIVMRSGILAHTLPVSVTEAPVTINQDLKAFYSDEPLLNEWLALFLRTNAQELLASSRRDGTTVQSIQYSLLKNTAIPVPPLEERRKIIEFIEKALSKQAAVPPHLAAARLAIDRLRRAILTAACSGRLTADWREMNADLASRSTLPGHRNHARPLIETPADWHWVPLVEIADLKGGVQKGAKFNAGEPTREVPYLRVANVQRGWLDLSEIKTIIVPMSKVTELRLKPGDILFNEGGDRDKLGRGWVWEGQIDDCIHQNHVFRARLHNPKMQPRFFSWFGNTIGADYFIDKGKQTVNLASLNMSSLKALPVPVPDVEEQVEIVRRVDRLLALADALEQELASASRCVERTAQAVLAKAFRGDLIGAGS